MGELVLKGIGGQCPTPVTIFGETPDARGLALLSEAMPLAQPLVEKALRCAIAFSVSPSPQGRPRERLPPTRSVS